MESPCSRCWYLYISEVLSKSKKDLKQIHQPSPSDVLVDDILLQIFDYLDEKDLENCETVCRRWQKLIESHVWKKLLHDKRKHHPLWQTYWKRIEMDKHLCYLENWEVYKIISNEIKVLYDNWWSGNFVPKYYSGDFWHNAAEFLINDNCLVLQLADSNFMIYDRHSMELKHKINASESEFICYRIKNGIIMCGMIGMIKVYDLNTGKQINEFLEPNGWRVICVCFGYRGLAVAISSNSNGPGCQLSFWKMDSFCDITYLEHLPIPREEKYSYSLGMDENFVVVFQHGLWAMLETAVSRIFIVSMETKKIIETITDSSIRYVVYDQGLLIIQYPRFIRVGVLSHQFSSHQTQTPIQFFLNLAELHVHTQIRIMTNSRYVALLTRKPGAKSIVTLYDIQTIKTKTTRSSFFECPFSVFQSEMDETQLVLIGRNYGSNDAKLAKMVLDFGRFQPFCYKHQFYSKLSGYMNLEMIGYSPSNHAGSITKNIPFTFRLTNVLHFAGLRKYYDLCIGPFALSVCAYLFLLLMKQLTD